MEFKGTEIFMTKNGIYEYTGVIHDDEKVYGRLANTDKEEECFKFSEVLSVWQEVDTGEKQCNLPVVTTRTFECQRCYTIYEDVEGEPPTTCVATNEFRTSGICGGELREVIA